MGISVLIPTLWRTDRATKCFHQVLKGMMADDELLIVTEHPEVAYYKYAFEDDKRVRVIETTAVGYWNCMNFALLMCKNKTICWTADDIVPHDGWLDIAYLAFTKHFPDGLGVVAMNDNGSARDLTCGHALSTMAFLHVLFGRGGLFPGEFNHLYLDTLIADRAKSIGRFYFCPDAVAEHMHYTFGKSERDKLNIRNDGRSFGDKETKDRMDVEWKNGERWNALERLRHAANPSDEKPRQIPVTYKYEPPTIVTFKKELPSGQSTGQSQQTRKGKK